MPISRIELWDVTGVIEPGQYVVVDDIVAVEPHDTIDPYFPADSMENFDSPSFFNYGELFIGATERDFYGESFLYGIVDSGFYGTGLYFNSTFINYGTFTVLSEVEPERPVPWAAIDYAVAYGFHFGQRAPDFINRGSFVVESQGKSCGVYTYSGATPWTEYSFYFTNTGNIIVEGLIGSQGVLMYNGGYAVNEGLISVTSGAGFAVGMLSFGHWSSIVNSGTIRVVETDGVKDGVGIYLSGNYLSYVYNSGTIEAAYALKEKDINGPFPVGDDTVINVGLMKGDIVLWYGNDRIENAGSIVGDVRFGDGRDVYLGGSGRLTGALRMGGGDDLAVGGVDNDRIDAGAGHDEIYGGAGSDRLSGKDGDDILFGDAGSDTLAGGAGHDILFGGAGSDTLTAQDGDTLIGGTNVDRLVLAAGRDTVVLAAGAEDIVENFDTTTDVFRLASGVFTAVATVDGGTRLSFEGGSVLLKGSFALTLEQWNALIVSGGVAAGPDGGALTGGALEDGLLGGDGADTLSGGDGADLLFGGLGDDVLTGGGGDDVLYGGEGWDVLNGGDGADTLTDRAGGLNGSGGAGDDLIIAGNAADILFGGADNDRLVGNGGADLLDGGSGDDSINGGVGADIIFGRAGNDALSGMENNDQIEGGDGDDGIDGGDGYDVLYGGGGDDYMQGELCFGGAGNDRLIVGNSLDFAYGGDGNDTLTGGDNCTLYGEAGDDSLGTTGSNAVLYGGDGNDQLQGYVTASRLYGGAGDDYIEGSGHAAHWIQGGAGGDIIVGGQGQNDTVDYSDAVSSVTYDLRIDSRQETGGSGLDWLDDVEHLNGSDFDDNLTGNFRANHFYGALGADTLNGDLGNDRLDGGAGNDRLIGGKGDDVFIVDSLGDVLVEITGEGVDTAVASTSYILAAGVEVENLTLTGFANINATGNELANRLTGNLGRNVLDGGAGADAMSGDQGDDTYIVDNVGDRADEIRGEGTDTVIASVTFTLGATSYVERLTLTGSANINGTGNNIDNVLTGNAGNNVLTGYKGNDVYYVQNTGDTVVEFENQGTDLIYSSVTFTLGAASYVERLTLTGTANINGTGNGIANTLTGNSGNNALDGGKAGDVLIGGGGRDALTGGSGVDVFVYKALSDSLSATSDLITDLSNSDFIDLSAIDGNASVAGVQGFSLVSAFSNAAGQMTLSYSAPNNTTTLSLDVNGDGVADMAIQLTGDHTDFDNFIFGGG